MELGYILKIAAVAAVIGPALPLQVQEVIHLRIAGHPTANTCVALLQGFFVPQASKRVAERTTFKVEFVEGYGASMVKAAAC